MGQCRPCPAAAFFDYLSDSFRPILGVLLGASLVIAIVNVIVALGIVPDGETSTGWILLKAIWEGVFTVLPIMMLTMRPRNWTSTLGSAVRLWPRL